MSELKTPRLLAAAKEFNIGQDTLVEFLVKKGFSRDELKPSAKLSSDQYFALQAEFQGDKVAKNKADQVEIPKVAAQVEPKKKRDEEDLSFAKKEDKKVIQDLRAMYLESYSVIRAAQSYIDFYQEVIN